MSARYALLLFSFFVFQLSMLPLSMQLLPCAKIASCHIHFLCLKIDMFHFENVFKTYFDSEHEKGLDFYRMKNILDKEIIVYPLVQGKYKKGLLVFEYPISDSNMSHIMQVIKGVLNNPEVQSSPTPDSSSENETKNN